MCGITGIYHHLSGRSVDAATIDRMCAQIVHRGPDDQGTHVADSLGIGMRRLSIIDLDTGSQPIFNEDRTVVTVFNGELYNFQELRADLLARGHTFATQGDTEVIVHLYEEYGVDFVTQLNGMFAIAVWDAREERLVLVRDRLGQKPLYYAETADGLVFGSELKCLLQVDEVGTDIDRQAVFHYFSLGYIPHPWTIYEQVRQLDPGGRLIVDRSGVRLDRYWTLDTHVDATLVYEETAERLRDLLLDAVRLRMISDVPLGAFLSGGVDSSIIVSLMAQVSSQPVKTFHIDFAHEEYSERVYARAVAEKFDTDHHELVVEPSAIEVLDELVGFFDEPFGDSSAIPTYYVSKLTRQHVTVALAGDGGDESFGGYERYQRILDRRQLAGPLRSTLGGVGGLIHRVLPRSAPGRRYFRSLGMPQHAFFMVATAEAEARDLLSREFLEPLGNFSTFAALRRPMEAADCGDALTPYSAFDLHYYLPDDILTKVDRMSMAHSLELRAPLLDYRVVELAAKMPASWKIRGGTTKWILKDLFADSLPEKVTAQRKWGFALPIEHWLRGELRGVLEDALADSTVVDSGIFNMAEARALAEEHFAGVRDRTSQLWNYLFFTRWLQQHSRRPVATA
ncbi:MAG: asparagine synthase (glutamine-hydrolyzing) [Planctomycetota bacterium]|nr:MAG: asparagine synthase (glutamine-hydrolyzing) [Planctomycetota bacterium]REK43597.1 MAG: asparagine synthase (glutamine-hydrolyzing) [Planctomycetota bacterium]